MAWQEGFIAFALSLKGFQLGSNIHGAIAVVTNIERYDSDGVASYEELARLLVVEHEGKDTVELLEHLSDGRRLLAIGRVAPLTIQCQYDLTVTSCLEVIESCMAATDILMVIYLAIDSKYLFAIRREQGLTA